MYESNSSLNSVQSMQTQGFQQFGMHYNNGGMGWQQQQQQAHPTAGNSSFPQQPQIPATQEFNQQAAVMTADPAAGTNNSQFPANQASSWQQQQWNSSNWQAATATAGQPQQLQAGGQQQQPNNDGKPSDPSYQRTFDYVQQCQNWTSQ